MIKHELLAPAGNMECLKQAIFNGADAIYIGCKNFGARKFASNFTNSEVLEAIKLCHLYGVKLYATMNTLVKDNEVEDFLTQIEFLHKNGIDAVLIQDFGMLCLVRKLYPNLEVHASTQANTSSKETAQLFYELGVKRVVFSREMSLEEINSISVPIETEVFVHGALCICYSGCCLMSSQIGNRSGNRGECAGSCRLPYSLKYKNETLINNKYLLSTKELNTSSKFQEILKSNINCFKIEGRMKSPEYVGFITRFYRKLIDNYENVDITTENKKLKTLFNRGFTVGHLFNCTMPELMNPNSPNHIGLEIGKVIEIKNGKIKIKLNSQLNQQDGIRFLESNKGLIVNYLYDKDMKLTSSATNICYIDNKIDLQNNDTVCKTIDYQLSLNLKQLPVRKVQVSISVIAKKNQPLKITVSDGINNVSITGNIIENSKTQPITKERIKEQILKTGQTPFECKKIDIDYDENIFISIKELNELRRKVLLDLQEIRENTKKEFVKKDYLFEKIKVKENQKISASITTEEQLLACKKINVDRIYVQDKKLYHKYENDTNIYYKPPRCTRKISAKLTSRNIVSDYFNFSNHDNLVGDYGLNVYNIYTAYFLYKLGLESITISVELTEPEIAEFINNYKRKFSNLPPIEMLNYGLIENMIIKGNILNIPEFNYDYELFDSKDRFFKVYYDGNNTHVLNFKEKPPTINQFLKENTMLRYDFYKETADEVIEIINKSSKIQ